MKKTTVSLLLIVLFAVSAFSQQKLPSVTVKSLEGKTINTADFKNDGKPIVLSFWATWCKPCIKELNAISEVYEDWQDEIGVKLIAISIDDARSSSRVAPFVNGRGWDYEVYLDANEDFKRALNVVNVPHTFVIDGEGNIVWQHTSYADGDEEELYEILEKVAAGKSIDH